MKSTQSLRNGPYVPIGQYGVYKGWWGNIGGEKQRGIITYGIAPNRLNPMAQAGHNAVFNIWRRFASQVWYFGPSLAAAWYVMYWADKRYACMRELNPADPSFMLIEDC
ncbi:UcrQ family protein [Colletotrichum limetticola]|uniref:Cytochrome b-c1 complex subunit 8 n=1 Tax=Colletotrichum limetticola TaxID=1209924 RepID=A0ABQ9Q5L0_9PEZI|nr:UcrQ family protein [Colletotrichum limetticola]